MPLADCPIGLFLYGDEANANMVAAAPELLAILQEIVKAWGFPNTPFWHRARDALDKAEGRKGAR